MKVIRKYRREATTTIEFTWDEIKQALAQYVGSSWEGKCLLSFDCAMGDPRNCETLTVAVMTSHSDQHQDFTLKSKEDQAVQRLRMLSKPFHEQLEAGAEYQIRDVYERLQNLGWLWSGYRQEWVDTN